MKLFYTILISFFLVVQSNAQSHLDSIRVHKKVWIVETSLLWPIYPGIYRINFSRQVWEKKSFSGELGIALNIQPERTDMTGDHFSEEFLTVIYRQFFWKGLHIEIDNNFAYGRIRDWHGTGVNYESYAIFHDFLAAYRFEILKKHKVSLTFTPQAGGGFTSYVNNSWPRTELPFFYANLLIGMRF